MSLPAASNDPEQTRRDIEHTRAELGETVAALAAKTDLKTHARAKATTAAGQLRHRLTQASESAKTTATHLTRTASQKVSPRGEAVKQKARQALAAVRGSAQAGTQTTGKATSALVTSTQTSATRVGSFMRARSAPALAAAGTAATLAIVAYRRHRSRYRGR
ncbi:DUF3618 domain-containing protein [Micromonospora sp. BQ11]|uniref:DUF3618 domain-containing protein n=1 Tax=Micromonospora sp. BQ11 TaxID=3452212 RepID=UPI003F8A31A5